MNTQQINKRASLLQKHLCDEQKELQALFALQALMVHMEQPASECALLNLLDGSVPGVQTSPDISRQRGGGGGDGAGQNSAGVLVVVGGWGAAKALPGVQLCSMGGLNGR